MINEQSYDIFGANRVLQYDGATAFTSDPIAISLKESDKPAKWNKISLELNGKVSTEGTLVVTIKDNTPETSGSGAGAVETNYVYTFASAQKALATRDGNPVLMIPLVSHISGKIKVGISGTAHIDNLYGTVKIYGG